MKWKIEYSAHAFDDLKSIYEYIAYELFEPVIAAKQVKRITDSIEGLDEMPMMYRAYEYEPWKSMGMRIFHTDNYVILYLPDETKNTVNVVRIIYGGRDIKKQLEETTI